jgi:hypothetical protein
VSGFINNLKYKQLSEGMELNGVDKTIFAVISHQNHHVHPLPRSAHEKKLWIQQQIYLFAMWSNSNYMIKKLTFLFFQKKKNNHNAAIFHPSSASICLFCSTSPSIKYYIVSCFCFILYSHPHIQSLIHM